MVPARGRAVAPVDGARKSEATATDEVSVKVATFLVNSTSCTADIACPGRFSTLFIGGCDGATSAVEEIGSGTELTGPVDVTLIVVPATVVVPVLPSSVSVTSTV